jgi:hypothetical protein
VLGLAQIGLRRDRCVSRDQFARILESGGLLLGIINDTLDSKIDAGKLALEAVLLDLGRLLASVLDAFRPGPGQGAGPAPSDGARCAGLSSVIRSGWGRS